MKNMAELQEEASNCGFLLMKTMNGTSIDERWVITDGHGHQLYLIMSDGEALDGKDHSYLEHYELGNNMARLEALAQLLKDTCEFVKVQPVKHYIGPAKSYSQRNIMNA